MISYLQAAELWKLDSVRGIFQDKVTKTEPKINCRIQSPLNLRNTFSLLALLPCLNFLLVQTLVCSLKKKAYQQAKSY
jgi:hypothetical protein